MPGRPSWLDPGASDGVALEPGGDALPVPPGDAGGWSADPVWVGWDDDGDDGSWVGVGAGVGGGGAGCFAGVTPGADLVEVPFHENATYPPSGTLRPPAPVLA